MSNILFLGSNSFTGIYFKKFILENNLNINYKFHGVDIQENDNFEDTANIFYHKLNPLLYNELEKLICSLNPIFIINFIGIFGGSTFQDYLDINMGISKNILDIISKNKLTPQKVLLIGSAAEYGLLTKMPVYENSDTNPVNFYGLSKLFQTNIAKYYSNNNNINVCVARTFNIIGKGISPKLSIGNFISKISVAKNIDTITTGNLLPKRDFLDIQDIISAYWTILNSGVSGEIYNICSGKSVTIQSIIDTLIEASQKQLTIKIDPSLIKTDEVMDIYGDNQKLKALGWKPNIDIYSSLKKIYCNQ